VGTQITQAECIERYGAIVGNQWIGEVDWCILIPVPKQVREAVINSATGREWSHVYCNKDMVAPLIAALNNLIKRDRLFELKTFAGCFNIRKIRGSMHSWSAHSWAMAIDFNAKQNPLGAEPVWSGEFMRCFTDAGFISGAHFSRKDGMHWTLTGF